MHLTYLLAPLLSVGSCLSSPLAQPDSSADLSLRAFEVDSAPWPEAFFEPVQPGMEIHPHNCPSFKPDCNYDSAAASLAGMDIVDSEPLEYRREAVCKYKNEKQEWFIKQSQGWYLRPDEVRITDVDPAVPLSNVTNLPHCLVGNVTVTYEDSDGNIDEGRGTPGACIRREIHGTWLWTPDLKRFTLGDTWYMPDDVPLYPAGFCRLHADDECKEPAMAHAGLAMNTEERLDGFIGIEEEEEKFKTAGSFKCF